MEQYARSKRHNLRTKCEVKGEHFWYKDSSFYDLTSRGKYKNKNSV